MEHETRPRLRLVTDDGRSPDGRSPEGRSPDGRSPDGRSPDGRSPGRARLVLRTAIWTVGLAQILLGLAQVTGVSFVLAGDGGHLSNESAAWNAAIGTALLTAAWSGRCSRGLFIMLTAFMVTLVLVTVSDLFDSGVTADRITTHLLAAVGYALIILLRRRQPEA